MSITVAYPTVARLIEPEPGGVDRLDSPKAKSCAGRVEASAVQSVRLTQRGRVVIVVALLALALAVLTLVGGPAASTAVPHHSTTATVVVQPGQTLWDIAAEKAPAADPREVVAAIVALNNLTDPGAIRVGQPLYVPAQ
jgi:LysM repeat protein